MQKINSINNKKQYIKNKYKYKFNILNINPMFRKKHPIF